MSALLTPILKFTIGVLFKKLRDQAARRLIGDPTDETFRELLSRELNEIRSKLDALIRKDLLSSVEFLEEGICQLHMSISRDRSTDEECCIFDADLEESLPLASIGQATSTGALVITSEERFNKAQECFKIAGQEATRAFSNPGLDIEDRILATKLRITARILEGVRDLESAGNAAIIYLEHLHELPAIQEAFSVYLHKSMKSIFNQTKRLQIIQNVSVINLVVFDFTKRFTRLPRDLFTWPSIELEDKTYQPVLRDEGISLTDFGVHEVGPFQFQFNHDIEIRNISSVAVNSEGNITAEITEGTLGVIRTNTGKAEILHSFCRQDATLLEYRIDAVGIDKDDNVFVITCSQDQVTFNYKLWVFDSSGKLKHCCGLEFLSSRHIVGITVQIAVGKKTVMIKKAEDEHVHICDNNGKLKFTFTLRERFGDVFLSDSDENEIIVGHDQTVSVYTYTGNFTNTIKLPEGHKICGLTFNQNIRKIIVLTRTSNCMNLLSYGKLTNVVQTLSLGLDIWTSKLSSHPRGLVVLITKNGGLFI